MAKRKKTETSNPDSETEIAPNSKLSLDPVDKLRLDHATDVLYDWLLSHYAESLPEGKQKDAALALAEWWKTTSPEGQFEREQRARETEQMIREDKEARSFVRKEFNRMKALPDPIFILDLPDYLISKLVEANFDTVGKVLFGMHVTQDQLLKLEPESDFEMVMLNSHERLLRIAGQLGYNLLGSRLLALGYLHRSDFVTAVRKTR